MARTGARNKRTLYARQTNGAQTERAGTFPLHLVKPYVPVASGVMDVYGRPEVLGTFFSR